MISNISDYDEEEEVPLLSSTLNIDGQSSSLPDLEDKLENISNSLNSERKKCQEKCIEVKTLTKKLNKIFLKNEILSSTNKENIGLSKELKKTIKNKTKYETLSMQDNKKFQN